MIVFENIKFQLEAAGSRKFGTTLVFTKYPKIYYIMPFKKKILLSEENRRGPD